MVEYNSESDLVKGVESSLDNGENDNASECSENNEEMTTKSCSFNKLDPEIDSGAVSNFENISVCNSSDVHFGNKTVYNGPITVKQFVYSPEDISKGIEHYSDGNLNISQLFQTLNGIEVEETTHMDPSFAPISDVKYTHFDKELKHSSHPIQGNSNTFKELYPQYFTCNGLPLHYTLTAVLVLLVTVLLIALTVVMLKYGNRSISSIAPAAETALDNTPDSNFTLSGKLRIMQRKEWLAQPVSAPITALVTPVPYVIISHTATEECVTIAQCVLLVRTVQTFHMESKGWWDIGYNFLVGGDGFAYVGRGWDTVGAHAFGYNSLSIGISFMGTFNDVLPPSRQLTAAKQLIELGVNLGKISKNYKLLAHKQVSATKSPGDVLYRELQKWPNWAPHP